MSDKDIKLLHYPVLLNEMLSFLVPKIGGNYLDCTFGAGGYTKAILNSCDCSVTALDQDPTVIPLANKIKEQFSDRFEFIQTNFADFSLTSSYIEYDGIVADLGVSSMQIDQGNRGFSFLYDGPLDMRMSNKGMTAAEFITTASEEEIANVIYLYGDEPYSRRIAKNIIHYRSLSPITTTLQLANIVREAVRFKKSKIDNATKTFQAIRIYINQELTHLERFLTNLSVMLKPGGRIIIISFHSLEDAIVKNFFKAHSSKKVAKSKYAKNEINSPQDITHWLKIITNKPIIPIRQEILDNYRSRSAKLRVAEKIIRGIYVA